MARVQFSNPSLMDDGDDLNAALEEETGEHTRQLGVLAIPHPARATATLDPTPYPEPPPKVLDEAAVESAAQKERDPAMQMLMDKLEKATGIDLDGDGQSVLPDPTPGCSCVDLPVNCFGTHVIP